MGQNVQHDGFLANHGTTFDSSLVAALGNFAVIYYEAGFGGATNNFGIKGRGWLKDEVDAVEMSGRHSAVDSVLSLAELGEIIKPIW